MSKTFFIGGPPRTGKSIILQELIKERPMLAASTDAIRSVINKLVMPEHNPRLFRVARGEFGSPQHLSDMDINTGKVLNDELASAEETWKSVMDFVSYYQIEGKDAAIEGVAVLPEKVAKVSFDHSAVFVVNLHDPTNSILRHARNNPNDWLNKYDEAIIRSYATFLQHWNAFYNEEAKKYGYPVVEIVENDFDTGIGEAIRLLQG